MVTIGLGYYSNVKYYQQLDQSTQVLSFLADNIDNKETTIKQFLVVNRNVEYLKKSAHDFLLQQDLNSEFLSKKELYLSSKQSFQKRFFQKKTRKPDSLHWPVERSLFWLSSLFGPRKKENGMHGFHHGIDMAAVQGTPIKAAGLGVIVEAAYNNRGYGKTIVITHADGYYQTRYAHLDEILVKKGQRVAAGQKIGTVGDTGSVRGKNGGKNAYHLHFEVKLRGKHIDPLRVLPA